MNSLKGIWNTSYIKSFFWHEYCFPLTRHRFLTDIHDLKHDMCLQKLEVRRLFADPTTDDATPSRQGEGVEWPHARVHGQNGGREGRMAKDLLAGADRAARSHPSPPSLALPSPSSLRITAPEARAGGEDGTPDGHVFLRTRGPAGCGQAAKIRRKR